MRSPRHLRRRRFLRPRYRRHTRRVDGWRVSSIHVHVWITPAPTDKPETGEVEYYPCLVWLLSFPLWISYHRERIRAVRPPFRMLLSSSTHPLQSCLLCSSTSPSLNQTTPAVQRGVEASWRHKYRSECTKCASFGRCLVQVVVRGTAPGARWFYDYDLFFNPSYAHRARRLRGCAPRGVTWLRAPTRPCHDKAHGAIPEDMP